MKIKKMKSDSSIISTDTVTTAEIFKKSIAMQIQKDINPKQLPFRLPGSVKKTSKAFLKISYFKKIIPQLQNQNNIWI